jgi:hypothetical protein
MRYISAQLLGCLIVFGAVCVMCIDAVFIPPPPPSPLITYSAASYLCVDVICLVLMLVIYIERAVLSVPTNWGDDLSPIDRYHVRTAVIPAIDKLLDTDGVLLTQATLALLAPDGPVFLHSIHSSSSWSPFACIIIGVMNALMSYVSRIPSTLSLHGYIDDMNDVTPLPLLPLYDSELSIASIAASSTSTDAKDGAIQREVEPREVTPFSTTDAIDIKRSARVATLLTDGNPVALVEVIERRLRAIIVHSLAVFDPRSRGNTYHACAILAKVIKLLPSPCVDIILLPRYTRALFPLSV